MTDKTAVLLMDPDATSQKLVAGTFNRAGLVCRFIREPRKTAGALRLVEPSLLLVHGEPGSPLVKEVLDALASDVAFSSVPVVLLCRDTRDARFAEGFRSGVVALLPLPFASTHTEQIKKLLEKLPERTGRLAGQGDRAELTALVDHLRRTQRSGVLVVDAMSATEGKAFFANGVLRAAQDGTHSGSAALSAILARPQTRWSFSDVADDDESAAVVIEVGSDEPLEMTEAEVALDIEQPISEEILLEDVVEEDPSPPPPPPGPPTPILLVDDDAELCRMFGIYFKKNGFDVTTAADGLAGFDLTVKSRFEAIVADLNMPRMDGWGLLRMLREDFRTRETPVAFLSCHDDYRETLRALDAGAQAYFSKSSKLDALALQIREVLVPRGNFRAAVAAKKAFTVSLSQVGPQWALRELSGARAQGRIDAKDAWANYQLFMREGQLHHAQAQSGRHTQDGERALTSFIASRGAEGTMTFGDFPSPRSLNEPLEQALARASLLLNENERHVRDGLMVAGKEIHVNAELYKLYAQVGPRLWLEPARLLCEEKLTPREVLARSSLSPLEIEEAIRDLIRRGVVRLTA